MANEPPLGYVPRQARGVAARERVFEAALDRFRTEGVDATRIEDVVADAGVSWGTFFRYFPRKEDVLLEAAARQFRERLIPSVERGLAEDSTDSRTLALELFIALLSPHEQPAVLHGQVVRESIERGERFRALLGGGLPLHELVGRILGRGQRRREVRTDLPVALLAGVLATGTVFTTLFGYFDPLRGAPERMDLPDPGRLLDGAFSIAWRGVEPPDAQG